MTFGSSNNPVQFFAFAMFVNSIVYNSLKYDSLDKVLGRHTQVSKLLYTILFTNMAKAKNCTGLLLLPKVTI